MPNKKIYRAKAVAMQVNWQKMQHLAFVTFFAVAIYFLFITLAHADATPPATTTTPPDSTSTSWLDSIKGSFSTNSLFMDFADLLFGNLSPMEGVLCTILLLILGDVGRGVATLAVMSMGIGAMMGKVSWGQALTVAVGIGIMFGAPVLLPLLLFNPVDTATSVVGGLVGQSDTTAMGLQYPCVDISVGGTIEDIKNVGNYFR